MKDAIGKAAILIEALPYIRRWSGKRVVVKVGGEVLDDPSTLDSFVTDVVLMRYVGIEVAIVHGGGRQITQAMAALGKVPEFVNGHRVTDKETMNVVKEVLVRTVNRQIVDVIDSHGARGASLSGEQDELLSASRAIGPNGEDMGFVGAIERVNPKPVIEALIRETIPVIAPIASGHDGPYNVNADLAAGAIAAALEAEKYVLLTNVPGLYSDLGDHGSLVSNATTGELLKMLEGDSLSAGMIPKIESVVAALTRGVPRAHILDGRLKHALLLEIFTDEGVGTMVER